MNVQFLCSLLKGSFDFNVQFTSTGDTTICTMYMCVINVEVEELGSV